MGLSSLIRPLSVLLALGVGQAVTWAAVSDVTPWIGTRIDPALIPPGEIAVVEAMLRGDAPTLDDLTVRAIIIDPKGIEHVIELPPTDVDHFAAAIRSTDQVGEHRVQVIAVGSLADGSRVEINPQAIVFEVDEDAPLIPQLPPEENLSLAEASGIDSPPASARETAVSEGVTADGWRTLSYPPWAPYALGGAALLLLLGGAAVIRRGRKREAVSVASEANPSPAAAESAAEALPIAAPDMLEEDSIPSLDPEPCEEQGEEKGEEEETPSDAEVSDAAEDMPDETADTDLTSLEEIEELMGLLTEEQLAALWKFAMEESGYGDRLKALLAKSRSAAASRGEGEPAAVTDAEEGEEDLMKFLSGEQLAALWKLALEESGYSDRIKSILAKQRAASQGEGESSQESEDQREGGLLAGEELADLWKSAMEESGYGDTLVAMLEKSKSKSAAKAEADATPSTQKEGAAEDLDDEQLSSLWDAALEESSGGGDGESAEGSEAPEKREEHPAPAERISQEELRALYDRAASQVSGGKPSSRGGSGV